MRREIRILFFLIILIAYSCEKSEYDFLFIHNHPPRLDISNNYDEGLLWVYGVDEIISPLSGDTTRSIIFTRFEDTIEYLDQKNLPVEPGLFLIFLTDYDTTLTVDTIIVEVRLRDKHTEIILEP